MLVSYIEILLDKTTQDFTPCKLSRSSVIRATFLMGDASDLLVKIRAVQSSLQIFKDRHCRSFFLILSFIVHVFCWSFTRGFFQIQKYEMPPMGIVQAAPSLTTPTTANDDTSPTSPQSPAFGKVRFVHDFETDVS